MSETPTFTHRHLDHDPTSPDVRPEDLHDQDLHDQDLHDQDLTNENVTRQDLRDDDLRREGLRDDALPDDLSDDRRVRTGQPAEWADPPTGSSTGRHGVIDDDLADDVVADDEVADDVVADDEVALDEVALDEESERPTAPAPAATADQAAVTARWSEIQAGFVDDPKVAVREADTLVTELLQQLADRLSAERKQLEAAWREGEHTSTEDLRVNLQHYRTLAQRVISL